LAYFGRDQRPDARFVNGKAWLSRFPIVHAMHAIYAVSEDVRQAALRRMETGLQGEGGELDEDRGALRITVRYGGGPVDLYTLHHTLGEPAMNAAQLDQLLGLLRERGS